ncbi:MAG: DUF5050 domain-containing protein [Bryobacteraceae bacterium]
MTFPPPGTGDSAIAVSYDGSRLAFVRTTNNTTIDLFTLPLSKDSLPAGKGERILSNVWIECLAWTPNSREIVFSGSVQGKEGLWRVGIHGERKLRQLPGIGPSVPLSKKVGYFGQGVDLAVSRQGGYLVYSQNNSDWNIWRVGLRGTDKGKAQPLITSTRDDTMQAYSADGHKIAFESDRSGTEEIWVSNDDGSDATQLTNFDSGWSGSPCFSRDGQFIAFDRQETRKWAIYVMTAQGGKLARISSTVGNNFRPSWSSDGRSIYFLSDRTGRSEVWRVSSTGGREMQITKHGGTAYVESPEGGTIYYLREEGSNSSLWKCSTEGTQESKVLDCFMSAFTIAKHGVYFLSGPGSTWSLRFFDFATRRTTTGLFSLAACRIDGHLSVSPDERWLLYQQQDGTLSDLMLVKNFR